MIELGVSSNNAVWRARHHPNLVFGKECRIFQITWLRCKLRGYGVIVQNLDVTEEYNYYYVVVYEGDDVVTAVVCMLCVCVCLVCVAHCHSLSIGQSFIMTIQFIIVIIIIGILLLLLLLQLFLSVYGIRNALS